MASEIRVDTSKNASGLCTVTYSNTGAVFSGISTFGGDVYIPEYITHTGDTNTKFGFNNPDTFSVHTNGSERVRIASTGNIGINTDTTPHKLSVKGTISEVSNSGSGIQIVNLSQDGSNNGSIVVNDSSGVTRAQFLASGVSYVRGGNFGVGINAPVAPLHIYAAANDNLLFGGNINASDGGAIRSMNSDASAWKAFELLSAEMRIGGTNSLRLSTGGTGGSTERLRITSAGKVGINQASPDGMLHVWSATAGTVTADADADELTLENSGNVGLSLLTAATGESSIYFGNPGTNGQKDGWIKYYHESHSTTANRRALSFKSGGGSEKMRLTAAGALNIGAASPTASENGQFNCYTTTSSGKAQFVHDAGTGGLRLAGTGNGSGANLVFSNDYNSGTFSDHWTLTHNGGDDSFRFLSGGTGGTERLRITSTGIITLGTSSNSTLKAEICNSVSGHYFVSQCSDNNNGFEIYQQHGSTATRNTLAVYDNRTGSKSPSFIVRGDGKLLYGNQQNDRGAELQYEGDQHACIGIHRNTANHGAPAMIFSASRGTSAGSNTVVQSGDYLGMLTFKGADGSDLANGAYITAIVDATPGSNDMPTRLGFWTCDDGSQSPTERFRLNSAGQILFNTTSGSSSSGPGLKIYPWASGGTDWGAWMAHVIGCPTGTNTPYYLYNTNGTNNGHRFSIKVDGGINNHSGNNTNLSDRREKKDIEDLPSTWEAIKQWRLRKFHFKDVPEDATEYDKNYGVIAQEIEEISPEVGRDWEKQPEKKDADGNIIQEQVMRRSVREQKIMWMSIKALQEAMTEIETLKAKVAALEST